MFSVKTRLQRSREADFLYVASSVETTQKKKVALRSRRLVFSSYFRSS